MIPRARESISRAHMERFLVLRRIRAHVWMPRIVIGLIAAEVVLQCCAHNPARYWICRHHGVMLAAYQLLMFLVFLAEQAWDEGFERRHSSWTERVKSITFWTIIWPLMALFDFADDLRFVVTGHYLCQSPHARRRESITPDDWYALALNSENSVRR